MQNLFLTPPLMHEIIENKMKQIIKPSSYLRARPSTWKNCQNDRAEYKYPVWWQDSPWTSCRAACCTSTCMTMTGSQEMTPSEKYFCHCVRLNIFIELKTYLIYLLYHRNVINRFVLWSFSGGFFLQTNILEETASSDKGDISWYSIQAEL